MNALVPCLIEAWGGYRSGQTGQTVNLLAQPSQVRILHPPLFLTGKRHIVKNMVSLTRILLVAYGACW